MSALQEKNKIDFKYFFFVFNKYEYSKIQQFRTRNSQEQKIFLECVFQHRILLWHKYGVLFVWVFLVKLLFCCSFLIVKWSILLFYSLQ